MVRPKSKVLQLRPHISGQSYVRVNDRNIYFGKTGDPKTLARYTVFISEYQANGLIVPEGFDPRKIDEDLKKMGGTNCPHPMVVAL